jgi:phage shock protein E
VLSRRFAKAEGARRVLGDLITPKELRDLQENVHAPLVIDVRGPEEYEAGHLPGAVNVPADELAGRLTEIPSGRLAVPY